MEAEFKKATKVGAWGAGATLALLVLVHLAFQLSPWPWVLVLRHSFGNGSRAAAATFAPYLPHDVTSRIDLRYDEADPDARLDVFYPSRLDHTVGTLPTIIWIHGGGWVAGNKKDIVPYQQILAHQGYTTVSIEYSHAPEKHYPTPLRQANMALDFLIQNSQKLHIDPSRLVIAGDSAGAQIAAQLINIISVPSYAALIGIQPAISREQLKGAILYCGVYTLTKDRSKGIVAQAGHAMLWAYLGEEDFDNPKFRGLKLTDFVDNRFPPTFISDGNADLLLPQSRLMAKTLESHTVPVDELFFPDSETPKVNHEYQFLFNTLPAQLSFHRLTQFLQKLFQKGTQPPTSD